MSEALIRAYGPEGQLAFELSVCQPIEQGRAVDWLRQKGPIVQLHCQLVAGGRDGCPAAPATDAEGALNGVRGCIEAPLHVLTAALGLMLDQGFGRLVLELPVAGSDALAGPVNAFWRHWVEDVKAGLLIGNPGVQLEIKGSAAVA